MCMSWTVLCDGQLNTNESDKTRSGPKIPAVGHWGRGT